MLTAILLTITLQSATRTLLWDHPKTDPNPPTRFDVSTTEGVWNSVGLPVDTESAEFRTYRTTLTLQAKQTYSVKVRACAADGCEESAVPYTMPADVENPRVYTYVVRNYSQWHSTVTLNAFDNVKVTKIEILADGKPIATSTIPLYTVKVPTPVGIHTVQGCAEDADGNRGCSFLHTTIR